MRSRGSPCLGYKHLQKAGIAFSDLLKNNSFPDAKGKRRDNGAHIYKLVTQDKQHASHLPAERCRAVTINFFGLAGQLAG